VIERSSSRLVACSRILRQVSHGPLEKDVSLGRRFLARKHFQQARLPGTIATDQADLVSGHDREGRTVYDRATSDIYGYISNLKDRNLRRKSATRERATNNKEDSGRRATGYMHQRC
jgi:hypothetical protein